MIEESIKEILKNLKKRNWYMGVIESCTGGAMSNSITNIPGASDVFKEGKVTYDNEAKIKAGVSEKIIKKYGVYSIETAEEMARKIGREIGIGITGQLPREVFVAVRVNKEINSEKIIVKSLLKDKVEARKEMKKKIVGRVIEIMEQKI